MKKRFCSVLLCLCMVAGMLPVMAQPAQAAGTGIKDRLDQLRNDYPEGSYWTVDGGPCPPPDSNYNHTDHSNCKYYDGASECMGFARLLFYEIFGIKCSTLDNPQGQRYDCENVAVGDYIRIAGNTHSAIVTGINGDELTVVDCNFGGRCQIKWSARPGGWKIHKKDITFFIHAPQDVYDRVNGGSSQPTPPPETEKPTQNNDFIIIDGVLAWYDGKGGDVTIPSGVTSIGIGAFLGPGLGDRCPTSVIIPNSVTSIEEYAFSQCKNLTSVTIPNSVTSIGNRAFAECTSLTNVIIPDGVVSIEDYAFSECKSLTSVTIPNSVTSIGWRAFAYCTNLTSAIIPNGITTLRYGLFEECKSLTSVTIPASVNTIEIRAFWGCNRLKDVYYTGTEAQWKAINVKNTNDPLKWATIHYNSAMPEQPTQPAEVQAQPTNDSLLLDGEAAEAAAYKIAGSNYFKLRDVAALLTGTPKQFSVGYDSAAKSAVITTGQPYQLNGSELKGEPAAGGTATVSGDSVIVNGQRAKLTVYKINGENYFKLRDLGKALDFYVGWSKDEGMYIDSGRSYDTD